MIIRWDPEDWQKSNVVQLDSDASDNLVAMKEIEAWAAANGFARTDEYWLRRAIRPDGRRVFRGICFRLTADERTAAEQEEQEIEAAMRRMPVTPHVTRG